MSKNRLPRHTMSVAPPTSDVGVPQHRGARLPFAHPRFAGRATLIPADRIPRRGTRLAANAVHYRPNFKYVKKFLRYWQKFIARMQSGTPCRPIPRAANVYFGN